MATTAEVRKIVSLLMKRPITEAIAMEVKSMDGYELLEITNGEWVLDDLEDEMTTGEEHGWIEALLVHALMAYVLVNKSGRVYPGDVTFVLDGEPGDLRITREPDVAFVAQANVVSTPGFIFRAPDLAIEIVSPSQSVEEIRAKAREYFVYGTQQAWIVVPEMQHIEVSLPDGTVTVYGKGQTIPGGDLLPGFTLDVANVFER